MTEDRPTPPCPICGAALKRTLLVVPTPVGWDWPPDVREVPECPPCRRSPSNLGTLVARVTPENRHGETLGGDPVGREMW